LALVVILVGSTTKRYGSASLAVLMRSIGLHGTQSVVAVIAIILGWTAHFFKIRWQYRYGVTEVWFAGVSAWNVSSGLSAGDVLAVKWITLVATAYIAARGFSNMSDVKAKFRATAAAPSQ
jgi:hypothetical protein